MSEVNTHDLPATLQFITSLPSPLPVLFLLLLSWRQHWTLPLALRKQTPVLETAHCELAGRCSQHPCLPDSPEPRQSKEAASNILVSTREECGGRKGGVLSNRWKPRANRLELNVKTRLWNHRDLVPSLSLALVHIIHSL